MHKILIIEDERPLRKLIAGALNAEGYLAIEAANGIDGVELAFAELPDLIVTDIEMPQMDGLTVLTWLRNDPATAAIPVILTTGYSGKVPMRIGMSSGADDYLPKPFKLDELLTAVKTRLQRRDKVSEAAEMKMLELRTLLSSSLPVELLAPLTDILGRTEVMRRDIQSMKTSELLECVNTIDRSATHLHQLVQHYLLYSEIELLATDARRVSEVRKCKTPHSKDVIEGWSAAVAKRLNRSDDLSLKVDDVPAPIGQEYLKRVIQEIVENAFKFSRPGTPVRVETRFSAGSFHLSVCDLGRGFDSERPAAAGNSPRTEQDSEQHQDSHLGMTIARRLVEIHGGKMLTKKQPGAGTLVEIIMPEKA